MAGFAGHRLSRDLLAQRDFGTHSKVFFLWRLVFCGRLLLVKLGSDSDWLFSSFCVRSWTGFRL